VLPLGATFELKIHQNADPYWYSVGRFAAGEGGQELIREGKREREGKGRQCFPLLLFTI